MATTAKLYLVESDGVAERFAAILGSHHDNPTKGPQPTLRSLVIESDGVLVLVEAGLSVFDSLAPRRRLGLRLSSAKPANIRTIRERLEQRGLSPDRVTDIVVTHLHRENIGGISDFPTAKIHAWPGPEATRVFQSTAAVTTFALGNRYAASHSELALWYGFSAYRLDIEAVEIHLIGLPGHTREHAGVVVRLQEGYLVHLGHALLSLDELLLPRLPADARQWARLLSDERPFEAMTTRNRLRQLAQHPPTTLSFVSGRGKDSLLSLGPHPHPSVEIL